MVVLSKDDCVQCTATYRALDQRGIEYEVINMGENPDALARAKELGFLQAPVVIPDEGEPWSGYNPDRIKALS